MDKKPVIEISESTSHQKHPDAYKTIEFSLRGILDINEVYEVNARPRKRELIKARPPWNPGFTTYDYNTHELLQPVNDVKWQQNIAKTVHYIRCKWLIPRFFHTMKDHVRGTVFTSPKFTAGDEDMFYWRLRLKKTGKDSYNILATHCEPGELLFNIAEAYIIGTLSKLKLSPFVIVRGATNKENFGSCNITLEEEHELGTQDKGLLILCHLAIHFNSTEFRARSKILDARQALRRHDVLPDLEKEIAQKMNDPSIEYEAYRSFPDLSKIYDPARHLGALNDSD